MLGCESWWDFLSHWRITIHILAAEPKWTKYYLIRNVLNWWEHAVSPSGIQFWIGLWNKRRKGKNLSQHSQLIRQPYQFNFVMKQIFSATERQVVRQSICLMMCRAVSLTLVFKMKDSHLATKCNSLTLNWSDSINVNSHQCRNKMGIS